MQCVERKERHAEYSKTRFGYEYVEVDIFFLCVILVVFSSINLKLVELGTR